MVQRQLRRQLCSWRASRFNIHHHSCRTVPGMSGMLHQRRSAQRERSCNNATIAMWSCWICIPTRQFLNAMLTISLSADMLRYINAPGLPLYYCAFVYKLPNEN